MTTDDMTPVTRGELRAELRDLEARLDATLDAKLEAKLDAKLDAKLARMMRVLEEYFRQLFGILDEKYAGLPAEVAALRRDMDAHVSDTHVHRAPRRTRRAKPRG